MLSGFRNLSIGTKLITGFLVAAAFAAVVGVVGIIGITRLGAANDELYERGTRPLVNLAGAATDFQRVRIALRDTALAESPVRAAEILRTVDQKWAHIRQEMKDFEATIVSDRAKQAYANLEKHVSAYEPVIGQVKTLAASNRLSDITGVLVANASTAANVTDAFEELMEARAVYVRGIYEKSDYLGALFNWLMVGVAVVAAGVALIMGVVLSRMISRPLGEITKVAAAIAKGDLTQNVTYESRDEVGVLASSFRELSAFLNQTVSVLTTNSQALAAASEELSSTSVQLGASAEETSSQTTVVSAAAEQVNRSIQTVATGAEEMTASIGEIAKNASQAAQSATAAVKTATSTEATFKQLGEASREIGKVVQVIVGIAEQTNLLALNATIEAARAGESGKGFAVVANEVKELAHQTKRATLDIEQKINAIQSSADGAIKAIAEITEVINRINDFNTSVANAVEEQSATTNEMTRNMSEAARGSSEITQNISAIGTATQATSEAASHTKTAAAELSRMSAELSEIVSRFKTTTNPGGSFTPAGGSSAASYKLSAKPAQGVGNTARKAA
ncbi:MAG: methyl-accepting chemotaxis protein [Tepidisphaerales bacterium]